MKCNFCSGTGQAREYISTKSDDIRDWFVPCACHECDAVGRVDFKKGLHQRWIMLLINIHLWLWKHHFINDV